MRRHDKRTREQRKADESALFAAACLGATVILIVVAILATSAQAVRYRYLKLLPYCIWKY